MIVLHPPFLITEEDPGAPRVILPQNHSKPFKTIQNISKCIEIHRFSKGLKVAMGSPVGVSTVATQCAFKESTSATRCSEMATTRPPGISPQTQKGAVPLADQASDVEAPLPLQAKPGSSPPVFFDVEP